MFTMKKFALLAVAGFVATSMFACSDDGDDEDEDNAPPPVNFGDGWAAQGNVTLGGSGNSEIGSFLDVDVNPFKVYTLSQAKENKDKIDLIFDGNNFLTPGGCDAASFCKDVFNENEAMIVEIPSSESINASSSASDVAAVFDRLCFDSAGDLKSSCTNVKLAAKNNGKYFVLTSATVATVAFVVVNGEKTELKVSLGVARSNPL